MPLIMQREVYACLKELGVPNAAKIKMIDKKKLKFTYLKLAQKYHPDAQKGIEKEKEELLQKQEGQK